MWVWREWVDEVGGVNACVNVRVLEGMWVWVWVCESLSLRLSIWVATGVSVKWMTNYGYVCLWVVMSDYMWVIQWLREWACIIVVKTVTVWKSMCVWVCVCDWVQALTCVWRQCSWEPREPREQVGLCQERVEAWSAHWEETWKPGGAETVSCISQTR